MREATLDGHLAHPGGPEAAHKRATRCSRGQRVMATPEGEGVAGLSQLASSRTCYHRGLAIMHNVSQSVLPDEAWTVSPKFTLKA